MSAAIPEAMVPHLRARRVARGRGRIAHPGPGVTPRESGPALAELGPCLRRLPFGLLGAVGLILILDVVISPLAGLMSPSPRSRIMLSMHSASRAASGPEAKADILCFGDSLVKLGVLPQVLEARLGRSAYNLAVLGAQAPVSYFLLRQVLAQGCRPSAVIVDFSALLLAMDPRFNGDCWSILANRVERVDLALRTRDPALAAAGIVPGLMTSWFARNGGRTELDAEGQTRFEEPSPPDDSAVFERNWRRNRGAQVAPRPFVPIRGALPQPGLGRDWRWKPQAVHASYVEQFLSLARVHRIQVYWILTPALATWRERNERAGTARAYEQFVRSFLDRFPELTVLDGQRLSWDAQAFRDPIHVNRDGAVRLSLAVADAIALGPRHGGEPPQWVELREAEVEPSPSFQDLLEDLDESRYAVGSAMSLARHSLTRSDS